MTPILFLSLAIVCGEAPQVGLTADKDIVNLGEIGDPRGTGHTFVLTNKSGGDLRITEVIPPCGCTKPKLTKNDLAPGEKSELQIAVSPLTQPDGNSSWKIIVKYSDGKENYELPVTLQAKIKKEILVEPATLIMVGSQSLSGKIRVIDRRKTPLKVTGASSGIPESEYQVEESTNTIEINVSEKCPLKSYTDELVIKTNDPTYPELRVPIKVVRRKESTTEAFPDQPELKFTGTDMEATVVVRVRGLNPVKISEVLPNQRFLQCKFANTERGQATLRITVNRKDIQESGSGEIIVKFTDEKEPALIVPVSWQKPE